MLSSKFTRCCGGRARLQDWDKQADDNNIYAGAAATVLQICMQARSRTPKVSPSRLQSPDPSFPFLQLHRDKTAHGSLLFANGKGRNLSSSPTAMGGRDSEPLDFGFISDSWGNRPTATQALSAHISRLYRWLGTNMLLRMGLKPIAQGGGHR